MQSLSSELEVPQHHIAYCMKYIFGSSFSDFKNKYRIAYFKEIIQNGDLDTLTIETLIAKSGFKSRSNFYTTFSKNEGMTPTQYLETLGANFKKQDRL